MTEPTQLPFEGPSGTRGVLHMADGPAMPNDARLVRIEVEDGRRLEVPLSALRRRDDGVYVLKEDWDASAQRVVEPVVQEQLSVKLRSVDKGGVRIRKESSERAVTVDPPLKRELVEVKRVPVNRTVDVMPRPRREGDSLIVPVVEEVLEVKKRYLIREEVQLLRRKEVYHSPQQVSLRREQAVVERIPPRDSTLTPPSLRTEPAQENSMAKTVVGLFDSYGAAKSAYDDLFRAGFKADDISMLKRKDDSTTGADDTATSAAKGAGAGAVVGGTAGIVLSLVSLAIPGIGPIVAVGPIAAALAGAGAGAVAGGLIGALVKTGVPEDDARFYEAGLQRGGTLLTVHCSDSMADQASAILERHLAKDIDTTAAAPSIAAAPGQVKEAVAEERLRVGRREVQRGGVRIATYVQEIPVTETVALREEHLNVERHKVDRPAVDADFKGGDRIVEMREKAEEAVVAKEARVVEEVEVRKDAKTRDQVIHETVRRKDVTVESIPADQLHPESTKAMEDEWRFKFTRKYASTGASFDQYLPAFRYGSQLRADARYANRDWPAIESDARNDWERNQPGTWDRFKAAVRDAWESMRPGPTPKPA